MEKAHNIILLLLGALILFIEIEFHERSRPWVIVLSLILMGVVTVDQVRTWINRTKDI